MVTMAMARTRPGRVNSTSAQRWMNWSMRPPQEATQQPGERPERGPEQGREHADVHGEARSIDDAAIDIPPKAIGAEPVLGRRRLDARPVVVEIRVVRGQRWRQDSHPHEGKKQHCPRGAERLALAKQPQRTEVEVESPWWRQTIENLYVSFRHPHYASLARFIRIGYVDLRTHRQYPPANSPSPRRRKS